MIGGGGPEGALNRIRGGGFTKAKHKMRMFYNRCLNKTNKRCGFNSSCVLLWEDDTITLGWLMLPYENWLLFL